MEVEPLGPGKQRILKDVLRPLRLPLPGEHRQPLLSLQQLRPGVSGGKDVDLRSPDSQQKAPHQPELVLLGQDQQRRRVLQQRRPLVPGLLMKDHRVPNGRKLHMRGGKAAAVPKNMVLDSLPGVKDIVQQTIAQDLLPQDAKAQEHHTQPLPPAEKGLVQPPFFPEQPGRGLLRAED